MSHLTPNQLRDFSTGSTDEFASQVIELHLQQCPECVERLSMLVIEDPLVTLVRQASASTFPRGSSRVHVGTFPRPFAKYDLIEELGRGGTGVVYRAIDRQLQREVAIKVVLSGVHVSANEWYRLQQEGRLLAQLKHPGLIQIFDVNEYEGYPYLAMELVDGPTLAQFSSGRVFDFRTTARIVLQLCEAISAAHRQSIIHRDLKPSNLLIPKACLPMLEAADDNANFTLKITDFGIAKQLGSQATLTQTGSVMGTLAYMAPEQALIDHKQIGIATDVYAIGAILYELLTKRPPFVGHDSVAVTLALIHDDPLEPCRINPQVPAALQAICLQCLQKSPAARYASADYVANDIRSYLANEPIIAKSLSTQARIHRWARRNPILASTYLLLFTLLVLHLFAKYILQLPKHRSDFGYAATLGTLGWAIFSTLINPLLVDARKGTYAKHIYLAVGYLFATAVLAFDRGPQSAPVPLYIVGIVFSGLLLPTMFLFATSVAVIAYVALQWIAWQTNPQQMHTAEESIAFVASLVLTGIAGQLWYRRQLST